MALPERTRRFLDRIEGGDALLFLYLAVIIRQYVCWLPLSNLLAWIVSVLCAAAACLLYVITKTETRSTAPLAFWVLVFVPLTFAFSLRVVFPDVSFDVLNYRHFHGIRGLHGFLYRPGDFFPTPAPYNTAPDMAMGITRIIFGYRLGTLINLFSLLWSARIVDRLLRRQLPNDWFRSLAVLVIFAAEHLFFEINTYMIDLLAVPLLLEAVRLSLTDPRDVAPGETAELEFVFRAPKKAGDYIIEFDMVAEHVTWFEDFGPGVLRHRFSVR